MIKSLMLKFGRSPGQSPLVLDLTPLTVFVGPNNSGKSRLLNEIVSFCNSGQLLANAVVLEDLSFLRTDEASAQTLFGHLRLAPRPNDTLGPGEAIIGKRGARWHLNEKVWLSKLGNPDSDKSFYCRFFLNSQTLMLDGVNRINLVGQQPAGNLRKDRNTTLQVLFSDDPLRKRVRKILSDAFGKYFVINPTDIGQLEIHCSDVEPPSDGIERGWANESVEFHSKAVAINQFSDGVKAFTGIIIELLAGDPKVLLIDEPEAFLHPALTFSLGKEIARALSGTTDKRFFVATHSPQFIMGCIHAGSSANIVRLTYRDGIATARVLEKDNLTVLMRDPLLRSIGGLSGLFYEAVIVTESDGDRAFYQEINERLLQFKPEWGIPNCLFLNAQDKDTVHRIVRPLRELGIPTVGIVDIDILKQGGTVWTNFLSAGFVPGEEISPLSQIRKACLEKLGATGKNMKSDGGIGLLTGTDKEVAVNLLEKLSEYGLFVVRNGELESWLKGLNIDGHGPSWLVKMFKALGSDPLESTYQKPADGDVWKFISQIRVWLLDAKRKGIPG